MSKSKPTTLVINTSTVQMHVDLIMPDGSKDSINVMHKSRANLPEGSTVCPNFIHLNPKLKLHTPDMQAAHFASLRVGPVVVGTEGVSKVAINTSTNKDASKGAQ